MSALKELLGFLKTWYVWLTLVLLALVYFGVLMPGDVKELLGSAIEGAKGLNPLGGTP